MTNLNRIGLVGATLAVWPSLVTAQASGSSRELVLGAKQGFEITIEVNDVPLRLRVDPSATGVILLNPGAAARAKLRPSRLDKKLARALGLEAEPEGLQSGSIGGHDVPVSTPDPSRTPAPAGAQTQLGSVQMRGKLALARAVIAGQSEQKVFSWFARDVISDADGIISPAVLPFDTVRFKFREPSNVERLVPFALDYSPLTGLIYRHPIAGHHVSVKFSVLEPATTATAAAAAVISAHLGGSWAGDRRMHSVGLGVTRPVRPLSLGAPLGIKSLSVDRLLVRISDHRGGHALPLDEPIGDDLLVTARSAQEARYLLVVGQDTMGGCSELKYLRRNRIVMTCR
ncbi:MAG TPA: hypothetical protein VF631_10965 [Allosphingosinicella sp.]|uniref:hypothetical protein n=1 Tax=Allosphingosinicella sp. TaxID=2823234 RepID=UPI002F26F27F